MSGDASNGLKAGVAAVLLGIACVLVWRFFGQSDGISEKAFYYDLSEKKLFVADRGLVPPIKGVNDATEDGMRAVVISRSGRPDDKSTHEIAYLEMYAPELKRQMEEAKTSGSSPIMGRAAAQTQRLVKRVTDAEWVSVATPEGEQIVSEWAVPGTNGLSPAVCSP
jgi:hypothetical protein